MLCVNRRTHMGPRGWVILLCLSTQLALVRSSCALHRCVCSIWPVAGHVTDSTYALVITSTVQLAFSSSITDRPLVMTCTTWLLRVQYLASPDVLCGELGMCPTKPPSTSSKHSSFKSTQQLLFDEGEQVLQW
jgi:hypothetical protein